MNNIFLKIIFVIFVILILNSLFLIPGAFAATKLHLALLDNVGVLKGQSVVAKGQEFTLKVMIYPGGVSNHTAKIELLYPSDLLEVNSFDFGSGWVAGNQPGDDLVDNVNGILVKAGNYSGGVSPEIAFGTISFLAKETGSAAIMVGGNSQVLDAQDQNVIDSSSVQASINIYEAQQLVDEYREVGIDIPPPKVLEKVPEEAQEKIPKEIPKKVPEKALEKIPEKAPEETPPVLFDIEVGPAAEEPEKRKIPVPIVIIVGIFIAISASIIYVFYRNKKRHDE